MKKNASAATETAAVAEQAAPVAPEQAASTKTSKAKKGTSKGQKAAKGTKAAAKPANKKEAKPASKKTAKSDATVPREFSKKAIVIEMMRRKEGATLAEIAKATEWQNHSIRGFISGSLTKKMGLKVESTKNEAGARCYRIAQ